MGNDFEKGESVICINDNFPLIPEFGGNGDIVEKPKVGEILTVDEVLGDFLMFEKYNTETSTNWFFFTKFRRAQGSEYIKMKNGSTITTTITNNSIKDAGKGIDVSYLVDDYLKD